VFFVAQTPLLLCSLDGYTQGHLVYHIHKEVPCWAFGSVGLVGNETANAEASEAVFLRGLSSEQPLGGNLCALILYSLISSWQDMWTNTLQSVKPCALLWQSVSFIREEEIMLTCL
jgi:hypothetical protein